MVLRCLKQMRNARSKAGLEGLFAACYSLGGDPGEQTTKVPSARQI